FDNHGDDIANDIPIPGGWEWVSGIIELSDLPDAVNLTPVSWATFDVQDHVHTTTCKLKNPDMTFNGSTPLTQSITGSINLRKIDDPDDTAGMSIDGWLSGEITGECSSAEFEGADPPNETMYPCFSGVIGP